MNVSSMIKPIDFIQYTPPFLLQAVADGALACIYMLPSVLIIILYSWGCFLLIDTVIRVLGKFFLNHAVNKLAKSKSEIGSFSGRLRLYLPLIFSWLLKIWVGLPMFHVTTLIFSDSDTDFKKLNKLISGYSWQHNVMSDLSSNPIGAAVYLKKADVLGIEVLLVSIFLIYTYWYYCKGFDITRRIREVGDALVLGLELQKNKTLADSCHIMRLKGWSIHETNAALWFLSLVNARITIKNSKYRDITPAEYGRYKIVKTFILAGSLTFLHPVVSGLYLASALKGASGMLLHNRRFCNFFEQLPADVRQKLKTNIKYSY